MLLLSSLTTDLLIYSIQSLQPAAFEVVVDSSQEQLPCLACVCPHFANCRPHGITVHSLFNLICLAFLSNFIICCLLFAFFLFLPFSPRPYLALSCLTNSTFSVSFRLCRFNSGQCTCTLVHTHTLTLPHSLTSTMTVTNSFAVTLPFHPSTFQ